MSSDPVSVTVNAAASAERGHPPLLVDPVAGRGAERSRGAGCLEQRNLRRVSHEVPVAV